MRLEIGCGNGFFLQQALSQGFKTVRGVEPSTEAVSKAEAHLKDRIVCDIMRPGLFDPATFDAVCLFQVFDHIADPAPLLDECFRVLKPSGALLILNHNISALSARLLGERSPIIDIEHTYLYNPRTLERLLGGHGFAVKECGPVFNEYSLSYLMQLLPLPEAVKRSLVSSLKRLPVGRFRVSVPLGNLFLSAQKN